MSNKFAAALLLIGVASAEAAPLDWVRSKDEMSALSSLASGYAMANRCNKLVATDVARAFLEAKLGSGHRYDAGQIADMMFLVIGTAAMQQELLGAKNTCPAAMKSFGPGGDAIPGLLK